MKRRPNIRKPISPTGTPADVPKAKNVRDLTNEENDALRVIVDRLLETYGGQVRLAEALNGVLKQPGISNFMSGQYGASFRTALMICELAGVDIFDFLKLRRPRGTRRRVFRDMLGGSFLERLNELPGLRPWVEQHGDKVYVSELIKTFDSPQRLAAYGRAADGQPHGGWSAFFADLRAGKLDDAPRIEGQRVIVRKEVEKDFAAPPPKPTSPTRSTRRATPGANKRKTKRK